MNWNSWVAADGKRGGPTGGWDGRCCLVSAYGAGVSTEHAGPGSCWRTGGSGQQDWRTAGRVQMTGDGGMSRTEGDAGPVRGRSHRGHRQMSELRTTPEKEAIDRAGY